MKLSNEFSSEYFDFNGETVYLKPDIYTFSFPSKLKDESHLSSFLQSFKNIQLVL